MGGAISSTMREDGPVNVGIDGSFARALEVVAA